MLGYRNNPLIWFLEKRQQLYLRANYLNFDQRK